MYARKWVFAAACLGMLLFGVGLITLGSMATELRLRFNLDEVQSGTLFSILPVGILAGSLCFGPVCDRYGYKTLLIISCIGMCIGFEGIAFSASLSYLNPAIFLFGLCAGIMNGATNALVADISGEAKGANLSILGVFFGIGALGMPFLQGLLKNYFSAFDILSGVGWLTLAVAVFFIFIKLLFPCA